MASDFPRGAEWRKWDIHIHTPFSELNNGFGSDFNGYFKKLIDRAKANNIAVVGLSDYFCIEGYKAAKVILDGELSSVIKDKGDQKYADSILFLPNIEFRSSIIVDGNRVNFHIVFSDEVLIEDIEEHFLREIKFTKEGAPSSDGEKWSLTLPNLENLGKDLKKQHAEFGSNSDLFVGMMNAVVDHEHVTEILEEQPSRFKGKYLLCLPCDEDLSKCRWNGQAHLIRKIFIQKSHILLSSNAKTRAFALGKTHTSIRKYLEEFKTLKPCLHGSDAHDFDEMFKPNKDRYTWIKADPTFSGLKQTLYEPEGRVRIQGEHPDEKNGYEVIDKVRFLDASGTGKVFSKEWIELNSGLNSIIGGKSSGKSLLLYQIANTIDPIKTQQAIKHGETTIRYSYEKYDLDFEVRWKDGELFKLSDHEKERERPITFIPQLYLNAVAESKGEDFHEAIKDILLDEPEYASWFQEKELEIGVKKKEMHSSVNDYMALSHRWKAEVENIRKLGDQQAIMKSLKEQKVQMEALKKGSELSKGDLAKYAKLEEEKNKNIAKSKVIVRQESLYSDIEKFLSQLSGRIADSFFEPTVSELKTRYSSLENADQMINDIFSDFQEKIATVASESLQGLKQSSPDFGAEKIKLESELRKIEAGLHPFTQKIKNKEAFEKLGMAIKTQEIKLQAINAKKEEVKAMHGRLSKFRLAEKLGDLLKMYKDIEKKNKGYSNIDPENETVLISEMGFDQSRFRENFSNRISKKMSLEKQIGNSIFDESNEFIFDESTCLSG